MVFRGISEGPSSNAVVYDYGRSSGRTILQGALLVFALLYLTFVLLTKDFAGAPGLAPVSRWTVAFTQWWAITTIPLLVALYGLLRMLGVLRQGYGLALDQHGLWFRDKARKTFFHIPWDLVKSTVAQSTEVQAESSGLRLYLRSPDAIGQCRGLSEANGPAKARVSHGRASVKIPVSGNLSELGRRFEQFAPQVDWGSYWGIWRRGGKPK